MAGLAGRLLAIDAPGYLLCPNEVPGVEPAPRRAPDRPAGDLGMPVEPTECLADPGGNGDPAMMAPSDPPPVDQGSAPTPPVRNAALLLLAVTIVGALLRLAYLGNKSLWYDEAVMYWIANGDLSHILSTNAARNSSPPLFALLLSGVLRLGSSEAALRAIACAAGIATIPAIYAIARRFVAVPWALFAALLMALSPQQILHAQQVREYTLTVLFASLLLLATAAFLERPGVRQAVALGTITLVSLFTHYGLGVLVAATGVVSVVTLIYLRQPARVWFLWLGVQVVGLATIAADVALGLPQQLAWGAGGVTRIASYLEAGFWDGSIRSLRRLVITQTERLFDFTFPGLLFVFLCVLGMSYALRSRRARLALPLFVTPILITFAAALAHLYPYNGYRQNLFLTPMFYVMAALGAEYLGDFRRSRLSTVVAAVLLAGYALQDSVAYYRWPGLEPLRPIVDELRQQVTPTDQVFVSVRSKEAFGYYVRGATLRWQAGKQFTRDTAVAVAQLEELLRDPAPLWLVFSDPNYDGRGILLPRAQAARRVRVVKEVGGVALYRAE